MYIGNAMKGNYAAVFAQLIINGESQGKNDATTGYAELSSQACLHISSAYLALFCQLINSLYLDMDPLKCGHLWSNFGAHQFVYLKMFGKYKMHYALTDLLNMTESA